MKHRPGFTIVEVIVVITAIAILAGIGAVTYTGLQRQAREDERIADMDVMASYLETYHEQKGRYPSIGDFYLVDGYGVTTTTYSAETAFYAQSKVPAAALIDPAHTEATPPHYSYLGIDNIMAGGAPPTSWPSSGIYTYLSYTETDNNPCVLSAENCTRFVLFYKDEAGTLQEVKSKYGN